MRDITYVEGLMVPRAPYCYATIHRGTLFASTQIGIDADAQLVVGVESQTTQTLDNLEKVLGAASIDFSHVITTAVTLTNATDYDVVNELYADRFRRRPARTLTVSPELPKGALVAMSLTAAVPLWIRCRSSLARLLQ